MPQSRSVGPSSRTKKVRFVLCVFCVLLRLLINKLAVGRENPSLTLRVGIGRAQVARKPGLAPIGSLQNHNRGKRPSAQYLGSREGAKTQRKGKNKAFFVLRAWFFVCVLLRLMINKLAVGRENPSLTLWVGIGRAQVARKPGLAPIGSLQNHNRG